MEKIVMAKFHVNPETGKSGRCHASVKDCPHGGDSGTENHYPTKVEAEKAGNRILQEKYGSFNVHAKSKLIDETETINNLENRARNLREVLSDLPRYDDEYDEIESNYFQTVNELNKSRGNAELVKDGIIAPPKPTRRPKPSPQEILNQETSRLERMVKALETPYDGGFDPEAHMEYNDNIIQLKQEIPKQRELVKNLQNKMKIKSFAQKVLKSDWVGLLPGKNREQVMEMIKANTNEGDTAFIRSTQGIKNLSARKVRSEIQKRLKERIESNPAEWKQGQKAAQSLTERNNRPEYIASIDNKHITGTGAGSKFTDSRINKAEDVIALGIAQRGGMKGDDRDKLIAAGADPSSFLPPESGVRYLKVDVAGTEAIKDTATMKEDQILTVTAKGRNDGKPPSLSLSVPVKEQPKVEHATVIIGPKEDENREPIKGTEVLWTMHPGSPTRGIRSNDLREKGLDDGTQITVGELRKKFGKDIKVNTKLVE